MIKQFYNRYEYDGEHGWERKVSQYDSSTIAFVSYQDGGNTIKVFTIPAQIISVKLKNDVKIMVGDREIETPFYRAPADLKVGDIVYVPIGKDNFNEAEVYKTNIETSLVCRAIDCLGEDNV